MIGERALAEFVALGPFFAVDTHTPGAAPRHRWQTLAEFLDAPDGLARRVDDVRTALAAGAPTGNVEQRVAASVAHLGLTARLIAPTLAATVLGYRAPSLRAEDLHWQNRLGGPYPLSMIADDEPTPWSATAIVAITERLDAAFRVGPHVLSGNLASAINSAAQQISTARPELRRAAEQAADDLLANPTIEGGQLRSGRHFRRRSCCLIYRAAGDRTAICGDCVLHDGRSPAR